MPDSSSSLNTEFLVFSQAYSRNSRLNPFELEKGLLPLRFLVFHARLTVITRHLAKSRHDSATPYRMWLLITGSLLNVELLS